jgi:DNA-binding GntR family transcriptional regulator
MTPLLAVLGAWLILYWWWLRHEEEAEVKETSEYRRLAMELRGEITLDRTPPGTRLPSTRDLAHRYGVTRRTVARALRILAGEGLIDVVPGRGCYVLGPDGRRGLRPDDGPKGRIEWHLMDTTRPGEEIETVEILAQRCQVTQDQARRALAQLVRAGRLRHNQGGHYRT